MSDVEDVAGQVQSHLDRWNPAPTDDGLKYVLGEVPDEGDGRATKAAANPLASPIEDNQVQYSDDGDDDAVDYSDEDEWSFQDLKDEIDRRNAERDDDDKISKGGGRDDLVARLVEDDS